MQNKTSMMCVQLHIVALSDRMQAVKDLMRALPTFASQRAWRNNVDAKGDKRRKSLHELVISGELLLPLVASRALKAGNSMGLNRLWSLKASARD
jgi:hypothetical protein